MTQLFGFAQFEYGFLLGPIDGRYMVRAERSADPEAILVLTTLGAPQRRLLRGRRGRTVTAGAPAAVPTSRATVVRPEPFSTAGHAEAWLAAVRGDADRRTVEIERSLDVLNRALRYHRAATADPHSRDVDEAQALAVRLGYGSGDEAAAGSYREAWELPRRGVARARRSMEAPEERFAALLAGRERLLACEELVLRARSDLDAGCLREAALQTRVALEALLTELPRIAGGRRPDLEADREPVGSAANVALRGDLPDELADAVASSIARMESALRARRLDSAL